LRAKKLAGAGLDVWEKEPPPLDHPLLKFDNVMVTPAHRAGVTSRGARDMGRIAATKQHASPHSSGQAVAPRAQPEVWPRYCGAVQGDVRVAAGPSPGRLDDENEPQHRDQAPGIRRLSLVILGCRWRVVDRGRCAKTIAAEIGGARSVPSLATALAWFGAASAASAWAGCRSLRRALDRHVGSVSIAIGLAILLARADLGALSRPRPVHRLLGNSGLNAPLYVYVSRWFDRRRGSALALIASGQYISGAIWPPIFERAIANTAGADHADVRLFELAVIVPIAISF
jgi:hypothetical protein